MQGHTCAWPAQTVFPTKQPPTLTRCWWYTPMRRWLWRLTMPSSGSSCPVMSFSSVDLPCGGEFAWVCVGVCAPPRETQGKQG